MIRISKLFNLNDPGEGRRPKGNDGPPDLDEVWRDFNNKLGSLFGRRGNGSGRPNPTPAAPPSPRRFRIGLGVVIVVLIALWLSSGFYIVQEGQVGVVTQFGKYKETTAPGFQWRLPYPIQSHTLVNISQLRTFEVGFRGSARNKVLPEALMLTNDENIVDMQFVVQYRLRADGAPDYLFSMRDPDDAVRQAAETAMREVVGKKTMDFVLYEGRTEVAAEVQTLMQQILDRYHSGIQISTVAIQNVQPPEQVQAAFDDAVKAGQDRERQINEGQAYANQVVPMASGQASRMIEQAEGYKAKVIGDAQGDTARFNAVLAEYEKAPQIMRDRLYLDAMQDVYGNASKVLIDTRGANNMIYLPLDKIIEQVARGAAGKPEAGTPGLPAAGGASSGSALRLPPPAAGSNTLSRDRLSR
ncbi:FtsH protease activity modulator HflK [Bordetella sp. FB-8]|uniref:FtsH protease activity modulator HflK n=1 Tax=Bordetella sp. FB-8 TaxID=1159870 RepID=UPI00038166A7|nr:FtsH protease activity modulator HflK [Bordetella sp. FB-8]